jgi:hypothetical protein
MSLFGAASRPSHRARSGRYGAFAGGSSGRRSLRDSAHGGVGVLGDLEARGQLDVLGESSVCEHTDDSASVVSSRSWTHVD